MTVRLMVMYEDQAVYVRYGDGSTLHVSPCGTEFMVLKAAAHPLSLQATRPVRQRTRFAISTYKELMQGALAFRNRYAARPYLPYELIPSADVKPFFSVDSEVSWPHISSCDAERGPGGGTTTTTTTTTVRSVEGRASLTLSSSGEDFLVEFLCSISQPDPEPAAIHGPNTHSRRDDTASTTVSPVSQPLDQAPSSGPSCRHAPHRGGLQGSGGPVAKPKATPQGHGCRSTSRPESEEMLYQCTTAVVQHHSCSSVSPMWRYPLSVARHYRAGEATHHRATPGGAGAAGEESDGVTKLKEREEGEEGDRCRCPVPEALPLRCPSPHLHRWKVRDPLPQREETPDQDFPGELMTIMWCQGVIYRILSAPIPAVEVSPGDGSVIRSHHVLSSYFTHYKHDSQSGQVKEITYLVNSLPPDVPGQVYSVRSIVSRASRILTCYNQARVSSRLPVMPSCLDQGSHHFEPATFEETLPSTVSRESHFTRTEHSRADIVSAELEKIKRFQFLLEHSEVPSVRGGRGVRGVPVGGSADPLRGSANTASEAVDESYVAEALQRTSQAIQDIDAVIAAATLT